MKVCGWLGWAALIACASPATAQPHEHGAPSVLGSVEEEVASLAGNLDNVVKLCSEESTRAVAKRKDIGSVETRSLEKGIFFWSADAPAAVKAYATRGRARFGRWFDPHATIWVLAYDEVPSCRIFVGGSPWTGSVRPALYAKLQDDHFWKMDGPEQKVSEGQTRAIFYAELKAAVSLRPMITVSSPIAPIEGGLQLVIGVHLINKEEK